MYPSTCQYYKVQIRDLSFVSLVLFGKVCAGKDEVKSHKHLHIKTGCCYMAQLSDVLVVLVAVVAVVVVVLNYITCVLIRSDENGVHVCGGEGSCINHSTDRNYSDNSDVNIDDDNNDNNYNHNYL